MSSKHTNVSEILAEYRAERTAAAQVLRQKLAAERQMLELDVAAMRRTWQVENAQSAEQTRAELTAFRTALAQEVDALRRTQREAQQALATSQAQELATFRTELQGDVQALLQQLQAERVAMGQAQRQELAEVRPALQAEVSALRRGFYYEVGNTAVFEQADQKAELAPAPPTDEPTQTEEFNDDFADLFTDDLFTMPDTPASPAIPELINLHGIGPKTEQLLNKIGIASVLALAQADVDKVYEALGQAIPPSKIEEWIAAANTAVGGQ